MSSYSLTVQVSQTMRNEFRSLRINQLDRALEAYRAAAKSPRPPKGWLLVIREVWKSPAARLHER